MGERICNTYGKGFIGGLNKGLLQINKSKKKRQREAKDMKRQFKEEEM